MFEEVLRWVEFSRRKKKPCMPAAAQCYNFPHISPPEYPSISYPHPSLSFWMKQGACVAVEMLLPNKERNSVVLACETLRLATASSPMVLWLTQRPYIVIVVALA